MFALMSVSLVLTTFKMISHAFSLSIIMVVELLRELWMFVNICTKKMMFMSVLPTCLCLSCNVHPVAWNNIQFLG